MSAADYSVGEIARFKGYTDLQEGQEPLLTPGQLIKIVLIGEDESIQVAPVTEAGDVVADASGDTVFPEEIEKRNAVAASATTDAPVTDTASTDAALDNLVPTTEAAPKKAKGGKKASSAPVGIEVAPPNPALLPAAKVDAKAAAKEVAKAAKEAAKAAKEAAKAPPAAAATIKPSGKGKKAGTETTSTEPSGSLAPAVVASHNVTDSVSVASLLQDQDALVAAKTLVDQVEQSYFTLGGVLHHIYVNGVHKAAGFDGKRGFANYVTQELGIQYRKAMYLIEIYTAFRRLGVDERRLTEIGWSKAKELTKVATPENFDELVTVASTRSREELQTYLSREFVGAGDGTSETRVQKVRLSFSLFDDQSTTVTRALEAAKAKSGSEDMNQALEYICAEWSMLNEGVETTLEQELARIGAKFGVMLTQVSAEGEQVAAQAAE